MGLIICLGSALVVLCKLFYLPLTLRNVEQSNLFATLERMREAQDIVSIVIVELGLRSSLSALLRGLSAAFIKASLLTILTASMDVARMLVACGGMNGI